MDEFPRLSFGRIDQDSVLFPRAGSSPPSALGADSYVVPRQAHGASVDQWLAQHQPSNTLRRE